VAEGKAGERGGTGGGGGVLYLLLQCLPLGCSKGGEPKQGRLFCCPLCNSRQAAFQRGGLCPRSHVPQILDMKIAVKREGRGRRGGEWVEWGAPKSRGWELDIVVHNPGSSFLGTPSLVIPDLAVT